MSAPPLLTLDEAAALVGDGDCVGVGGTLFTRLPMALVRALAAAGRRDLWYVSWGGGLPLEILLAAEAVRRLTFCFSSLDIFGIPPLFREAMERGALEVDERTALAFIQGLDAGGQRLASLPMQAPAGDMLALSPGTVIGREPVTGAELAFAGAITPDVTLLHCQRADSEGNLEISGARGLDVLLAASARRVIATVEEVVAPGELGVTAQAHVLPRHLVAAVVLVPGGARPSSCLPYYTTDLREIGRVCAEGAAARTPGSSPAPSAPSVGAARLVDGATLTHASLQPHLAQLEPGRTRDHAASIDEVMVCWLARQYDDDSICSAGATSPLALTSYLLAKATHAPGLTIFTTGGCYLDIALRPMLLALAEPLDMASARVHCGGEDSYHLYYQQGRVTHEVVSAAQVDAEGWTNNVAVISPSGRVVRLPGQGGMADVANLHRNFLLYHPRHSPLALVERVAHRSAGRSLLTAGERQRAGLHQGRVQLVTNLCVFRLDEDTRRFALESLHPGVTLDDVRAATGFAFAHERAPAVTPPPDEEHLAALRHVVDPLSIRRLEFHAARDRAALLDDILGREDQLVSRASRRGRLDGK